MLILLATLGALAVLGAARRGGGDARRRGARSRPSPSSADGDRRGHAAGPHRDRPGPGARNARRPSRDGLAGAVGSSGASLNDRGFRLLQGGNAAAALPLLEQAVSKLEGTGSLAEAYASYNLAWARFATGSCDGVKELLERSKRSRGSGRRSTSSATRSTRAARSTRRRQDRNPGSRRVSEAVAVRAPHLQHALRSFVLGAFAYLLREIEEGRSCRSRSSSTSSRDGPALYEYRPLVRSFVEERAYAAARARRCGDRARGAVARAGRGDLRAGARRRTAVGGGGALPDGAARPARLHRGGVRRLRLGRRLLRPRLRRARALALRRAPDVRRGGAARRHLGLDAGRARARACGCVRSPTASSRATGPRRARSRRADFGREADRYCVLELRAALAGAEDPPDAPAEIADAVSAIRLATAAPLSAGPVLFETLDGRPSGSGPFSRSPRRSRRASPRGSTPSARRSRPSCSDGSRSPTPTPRSRRRSTAGSCRCSRTSRSAPSSCGRRSQALLGETWPLRAAVLLEAEPGARSALHAELAELARGDAASAAVADAARRALVEALRHGDRQALLRELDEALLGVRERRPLRVAV